MLQELYSETGAAAQAIVEEVAPAVNETTKEEIAGAAVDRAEAIADHIADTVKLEQSEHTALVEACSQVIYAETLAELADNVKITALESLFTEEYLQDFYSNLEDDQDVYSMSDRWEKVKGHVGKHSNAYIVGGTTVAGTGVGYIAARRAAKKRGLQPGTPEYKKFVAKRALGGAAVGAAAGGLAVGARKAHSVYKDFKDKAETESLKKVAFRKNAPLDQKGYEESMEAQKKLAAKKGIHLSFAKPLKPGKPGGDGKIARGTQAAQDAQKAWEAKMKAQNEAMKKAPKFVPGMGLMGVK